MFLFEFDAKHDPIQSHVDRSRHLVAQQYSSTEKEYNTAVV